LKVRRGDPRIARKAATDGRMFSASSPYFSAATLGALTTVLHAFTAGEGNFDAEEDGLNR
jgi:hypothetical protein